MPAVILFFKGGIVPLFFLLGACSMSERVEYSDAEGRLPANFFSTIETYKVSTKWLESQLGRADIVQHGPREQLIYTYKTSSSQIEQVNYLWLINSSKQSVATGYFHFVFVDDRLSTYWQDSQPKVELNEPPVNTVFVRDEIALVDPSKEAAPTRTHSEDDRDQQSAEEQPVKSLPNHFTRTSGDTDLSGKSKTIESDSQNQPQSNIGESEN